MSPDGAGVLGGERRPTEGIDDSMDKRGQWGCAVAPAAGLVTGALGSGLLAAAWRACDVGVNGAANGFALVFYGALLSVAATVYWWVLVGYAGRRNLTVALLGGTVGTAAMVWIFVSLLQVPHGYRC